MLWASASVLASVVERNNFQTEHCCPGIRSDNRNSNRLDLQGRRTRLARMAWVSVWVLVLRHKQR